MESSDWVEADGAPVDDLRQSPRAVGNADHLWWVVRSVGAPVSLQAHRTSASIGGELTLDRVR